MKRRLIRAIAVSALALGTASTLSFTAILPLPMQSAAAQTAAVETRTFAIENMTCALCPVTVRTAMEAVVGVLSVDVDFDAKSATVVFDPELTTADAIAAASTNVGYPARLVQQGS